MLLISNQVIPKGKIICRVHEGTGGRHATPGGGINEVVLLLHDDSVYHQLVHIITEFGHVTYIINMSFTCKWLSHFIT